MGIRGFYSQVVGFDGQTETLLENFDTFNNRVKHRQLFLSLIKPFISKACPMSNYEIKRLSFYPLNTIFETKIKEMMPLSNVKIHKISRSFTFSLESTLVINNYVHKQGGMPLYHESKLHGVAKLIGLCFMNDRLRLLFDINVLFHQFVFNKLKRMHKDKTVIDSGHSICILSDYTEPLKIYTSWKSIDQKRLNISEELKVAVESVKQSEFKQVYLVYPKLNGFKRHIPVEVKELKEEHYRIKVVPYSLRSTLRKLEGLQQ